MAKICRSCNCCVTSHTLAGVENVTDVPDYHLIPVVPFKPYPRPVSSPWIPGCDGDPAPEDGCDGTDQPPCDEWPLAERPVVSDCAGTVFKDWNCYDAATDVTVSRIKRGFKAVQSAKQWHGRPDFLSNDFYQDNACGCMARKRFRTIRRKV